MKKIKLNNTDLGVLFLDCTHWCSGVIPSAVLGDCSVRFLEDQEVLQGEPGLSLLYYFSCLLMSFLNKKENTILFPPCH